MDQDDKQSLKSVRLHVSLCLWQQVSWTVSFNHSRVTFFFFLELTYPVVVTIMDNVKACFKHESVLNKGRYHRTNMWTGDATKMLKVLL